MMRPTPRACSRPRSAARIRWCFLENELIYGRSFELPELDDHVLPIGKARIMREGSDVTIVSYSIGVGMALEAADLLAGEGIEAEVLDLRTLRPLDARRC
jgi:pyruvate dehydrogenase E1 component beta subunit